MAALRVVAVVLFTFILYQKSGKMLRFVYKKFTVFLTSDIS